jgi:hypothetical protein
MRKELFAGAGTLLFAAALVSRAGVPVAAQTGETGRGAGAAQQAAAKPWTPARTPDGQPDLQGIWTNLTITPLERPAALAGKQALTASEAAALEKQAATRGGGSPASGDPTAGPVYNNFAQERGDKVTRGNATSLVVDPPDGRIPALTAEAQKRIASTEGVTRREPESWDDLSAYIRCLTRGMPHSMLPGGSNSNFEIVQVPGYVVVLMEMIHDVRIIPLDGRPHVAAGIRQWLGDSRGHWEGNTLVVDTTNFPDAPIAAYTASSLYKWLPQTNLHLVERFTRVDADTIDYQFTVDDPSTFARPWTVMQSMRTMRGLLYEYSCHEGNWADVEAILKGARAQEKARQQATDDAVKRQ